MSSYNEMQYSRFLFFSDVHMERNPLEISRFGMGLEVLPFKDTPGDAGASGPWSVCVARQSAILHK